MIKMDANNPGFIFIISGICVLLYGAVSVCLYTYSADHVLANLLFQGKVICCFGFVQAFFGCLTMLRDNIVFNRFMSFIAFVLWNVWILLNMMRNTYLAYNYEMGWSCRFVLSVMFAVPWALSVKRQLELHRQLTREGDTRRRN
ncbi:uncharacterized protein LOC132726788 [Ruditapes philippinarum]|uniref:uncharacterized protein LOC132726788 n=1 Tax=Ruditapes philippinarum TaxID=129788 RepID=UPI00295B6578|nr:uncharacterized protein LOC132726788 [Ruditapes philippinarum]XP_060568138.1 uncharacterized protein LOC132726788 [Ruditapes philippinarum]